MSDDWDEDEITPRGNKRPSKSRHEIFEEQLRKRFMLLPRAQKDLIREAHDAGLEWRGEDTHQKLPAFDNLTHFEHVYREWKTMKEIGIEEYRKTALDRLDKYERRNMARSG